MNLLRTIVTAVIGCVIGSMVLALSWANEGERRDAASGAAEAKDAEDEAVAIDDLPAAARDAIRKLAGDSKLEELSREEPDDDDKKEGDKDDDDDDVVLYEASWLVNGNEHEVLVTAGGDIVEQTETLNEDAVPAAVREEAQEEFPNATAIEYERRTIIVYEIEVEQDGKERELLLSPTGEEMEIEVGDEEDE